MKDIIINLQEPDTWKIQLTIAINFVSSKDAEEKHVMHSKSENKKFALYNNVNGVVDKPFLSHFFQNIKAILKHQWEGVILFSAQSNFCITNVIK